MFSILKSFLCLFRFGYQFIAKYLAAEQIKQQMRRSIFEIVR